MADPNDRRNIVLIIADDLGLTLNCYGVKSIQTPNLDRLAAEGTQFTHAFASTASCSGSRSTIYTGLHTHQNGMYGLHHGLHHFQTHAHVATMPSLFKDRGYQTGIIGKVHVGPRDVYSWEVYEESATRDVRWNAQRAGAFFDNAAAADKPFHLTVGYRDPHRDDTRGGFGNDDPDVLGAGFDIPHYGPDDVEVPSYLSDLPVVRQELAEYYTSVSRMDLGVGLLLDELKRRDLDKTTLVMFVSDNGAPFLNSKTTLYDAGVRLPLIVRRPHATPGVINPNMVSFVDILPTCLDWAGDTLATSNVTAPSEKPSPPLKGHSFLPVLECADILGADRWQQHVFGSHTFHEVQNYWPTRFLRTRQYKYHRNIAWRLDFPFGTDLYGSLSWEAIRNSEQPIMIGGRPLAKYLFRGPEELFDLQNDPDELHNIVDDPAVQEQLAEFRGLVERWQFESDDAWLMRDGVSVLTSLRMQRQGLELVDRFDFDHDNPGTQSDRLYKTPAGIEKEAPKAG
ncbi:uncharacterized protein PG998_000007 [Apiospora kogelbergensis]|uniref:uncharacterized protein n=1 Tax=Apiospora kogelbergensis TaxID=1337665 RepID=UPI00312F0455